MTWIFYTVHINRCFCRTITTYYVVGNLPSTYSSRARLDIAPWGQNKKIKRVNCSIRSVRFAFKSICLMQFMNFDLTNSLFGLLRSYRLIVFATCLLRILLPGIAMGPGYSLKFTNILKYINWKYFVKHIYFTKTNKCPFLVNTLQFDR